MPDMMDLLKVGLAAMQAKKRKEDEEYVRTFERGEPLKVLAGDPGGAPTGLAGMVLNAKNVKQLEGLLKGLKPRTYQHILTFMKEKYPTMFASPKALSLVKKIDLPVEYSDDVMAAGQYNPYTKTVEVLADRDPMEFVESLGHELTHSIKDRKGLLKIIADAPWNKEIEKMHSVQEMLARRGGRTAYNTYKNFLNLLGQ